MNHKIDLRTVESMVVLNALSEYASNKEHNKIDVYTACKIHQRITDTVSEDLKTLKEAKNGEETLRQQE